MNTTWTDEQVDRLEKIYVDLGYAVGNFTTISNLVFKVVTRFDNTLDTIDDTLENINNVVDQLQLTLFFVWVFLILLIILPICCTLICLCKAK